MSTTPTPGPGRESLPPKKRDPRPGLSEQLPAVTFKVPFPYKSHNVVKTYIASHSDLLPPTHASVPPLYQPWTQSPTTAATTRANHLSSPIRDSHGWAEWRKHYYRDWAAVPPGWHVPYIFHHRSTHPSEHPRCPSICRNMAQPTEEPSGVETGYSWHFNTKMREKLNSHTEQQNRQRGPYLRREKQGVHQPQPSSEAGSAPLNTDLSPTAYKDLHHHPELVYTHHSTAPKYPASGQSPLEFAAQSPIRPSLTVQSTEKYWTVGVTEKVGVSPPLSTHHSSYPSTSSDQLPWLLPHFAAGSLIELRDGRLRRVEDLQTEDFLIGAEACPALRLSYCTVQHISPSTAPSLSRLLILLHEEHTQEFLDVYVEYPFFVRGRGWSSCCPPRTARLCGLRCHQLSVGDVCLALIPTSPSAPLPTQPQEPGTPARRRHGGHKPLQTSCPHSPLRPAPDRPIEGQGGGLGPARKRRWSAPELCGPGTNCPY
ncbi:ataxin-1 [Coregonus clupeaformis]|uniref:ataxin-1 n=1 Tax=Coregonus clupeaformis TaxID=59861 RepID=UPI001BDFD3E9|nr:ataxin-1 [Coregonus clupeaformis]